MILTMLGRAIFSQKVHSMTGTGAGCVGPWVGQSGKRSMFNTEHTDIFISQRRLKIFDPCLILD